MHAWHVCTHVIACYFFSHTCICLLCASCMCPYMSACVGVYLCLYYIRTRIILKVIKTHMHSSFMRSYNHFENRPAHKDAILLQNKHVMCIIEQTCFLKTNIKNSAKFPQNKFPPKCHMNHRTNMSYAFPYAFVICKHVIVHACIKTYTTYTHAANECIVASKPDIHVRVCICIHACIQKYTHAHTHNITWKNT